MIQLNNVSMQFGATPIFDAVSIMITAGDKIGLVGRNGAGKSTLLKLLMGKYSPEEGNISMATGTRLGYLPQELAIHSTVSVMEEAFTAFEVLSTIQSKVTQLQEEILKRDDYESQSYLKLIEELTELENQKHLLEQENPTEQATKVLTGLGFTKDDMDRSVAELSGGWQMRVELAKILLSKPDLLLLDEPTNHLDIESIIWLESFLQDYSGAILMVSHDRTFLDNITNRTLELLGGKANDYRANYTKYKELREQRREQQILAKKNQDRERSRLQDNVNKFRAKKNKAKFAQTLIKRLDKMEIVEVEDIEDHTKINLRFPEAPSSGRIVLKIKNANKSFGENHVIKDATFEVQRGECLAFVGQNGTGKTTMSRMIVGQLDYQGEIELGHNVSLGYFAQHQAETLSGDKTVFQTIDDAATGEMRTRVRSLLGAFLFSGDTVDKKVKVLSGGEKSRLAMAKLLLEPSNVLVLDEPTNHLDIRAKEILKQAITDFKGTKIIVSHDRDFLAGLCDRILEFTHTGIKEHLGGIEEFLNKRNADSFRAFELNKEAAAIEKKAPSENKKKRENDKKLKQLRNKLSKAERRVTLLEQEIKNIEEELRDPEKYKEHASDQQYFENYEKLKADLGEAMTAWENLVEEVEAAS